MIYRKLGRTGVEVGVIGLGLEYLEFAPKETVVSVIREALDNGVNYMDLFMASPNVRDYVGIAVEGKRDKVMIAGHLGSTLKDGQYFRSRDKALCKEFFHDLLKRLNTTYIDVLMLHFVDEMDDYEEVFGPGGIYEIALGLKEQGKARFIGMSSHKASTSLKAVKNGYIDVLMFPVNPVFDSMPGDADIFSDAPDALQSQAPGRKELYHACAANDVAIIAMKPYGAGRLFNPQFSPVTLTPVQCLGYALSQPGVSGAVPGCKTIQEVKAAVAFLEASDEEKDFSCIHDAQSQWNLLKCSCMYCNHCLPCPSNINIARVMRIGDTAEYGVTDILRQQYKELDGRASDCIQCGQCMERCPFGVDVISKMEKTAGLLE